jgi:Lipocalin-like domain
VLLRLIVLVAALVAPLRPIRGQGDPKSLVGTWEFVSRIDRDSAGRESVEPTLGRSPLGFLIYDAAGHVVAQLMARDRRLDACSERAASNPTNSTFICRYDAYFGRYEVNRAKATVTHVLEGALAPADVGKRLPRRYRVGGDTLTLAFETIGASGRRVTRTLVLHRVSH